MSYEPDTEEIRLRKQQKELEKIRSEVFFQGAQQGVSAPVLGTMGGTATGQGSFNTGAQGDVVQDIVNGFDHLGNVIADGITDVVGSFIAIFAGTNDPVNLAIVKTLNGAIAGQRVTICPKTGESIKFLASVRSGTSTAIGNILMPSDLTITDEQCAVFRYQEKALFTDNVGGWLLESTSVDNEGAGGAGSNTDIGDVNGAKSVDLNDFDHRTLHGNVTAGSVITFSNIPANWNTNLRLYIKVADPQVSIVGTAGTQEVVIGPSNTFNILPLVIDDFVDIVIQSSNQANTVVLSVKKNDEFILPSVVQNFITPSHNDTSVSLGWDEPATGNLPMTYDVRYSLSSAEDGEGAPISPITDPSQLGLTVTNTVVTGLSVGTQYHFWVRATNSIGNSLYVGPLNRATDGTYSVGDVNFTLTATDFDVIQASWTQPTGKTLQFSLWRDESTTGILAVPPDRQLVEKDSPASGITNTHDDSGALNPSTEYFYVFQVINEVNVIISTLFASQTTLALTVPVLTLGASGLRLTYSFTMPANINQIEIERAKDASFTLNAVEVQFNRGLQTGPLLFNVDSGDIDPATLFHVRSRYVKNQVVSAFDTTQTQTTGTLPTPQQPTLTVSSPSTGQVRIKVRFNNATSVNEMAIVSWRLQSSVGEYFDTIYLPSSTDQANSYDRDIKPSDNLDARENRIEVIREGAFPNGVLLTFRCVACNATSCSSADTDNQIINT